MEDLDTLHSNHLGTLTGEDQLDYLLSCQDYLKEGDVNGWRKRFAPGSLTESKEPEEQTKKKKRRMNPDAVLWKPHPACIQCKSMDIIEDTQEGSVVCTACGLIQSRNSIGMGIANMSHEQLKNGNRKQVHRYSRVVYFRSFLMGFQGMTSPNISQEELKGLQVICGGSNFIDDGVVNAALKKMKLTTRFRRHRFSLAVMLNPEFKPIKIEPTMFFELLRLFRVVECFWMHGGKRKLRERRVFFSYPYVFYQLCHHLNLMHLTGPYHLLNCRDRLNKLHYVYGCIAKQAKLQFNVNVYR